MQSEPVATAPLRRSERLRPVCAGPARVSIPGARRAHLIMGALAIGLLLCVLLNLGVGAYAIEPLAVLRIVVERLGLASAAAGVDAVQSSVFWNIRLPRVLLALLAGAGLAMSGGAVQGLFRNPLAEPGLLGVSAGASLFVALFILLRDGMVCQALGAFGMPLAGFVGASVTLFAIYRLGTCAGQTAVATLLLAGVAINALCGAVLGLVIFLANDQQLRDITFWTMGSLAGATWSGLGWVSLLAVPALLMLARLARPLNAMLLGESEAGHLGCHVQGVKRLIVLGVGLTVGGVVALSGSIGFVGLIVPHLARMLIGADHRRMLPAAALMGGGLLLLADLVARTIAAPLDLPIGVITTFAGAPFFLIMLLRGRRRWL